jgi:ATP-dependent DNA helicase RecG
MAVIKRKIPKEESQLVEFKSFLGGVSDREMARTLCAFSNSDGGEIYLGVTDSGKEIGLKVTPDILDRIQNAAREGCTPPVPISLKEIPIEKNLSVLRISALRSANLHSTSDGHSYIRVGTQDKRVMGDELLRLAESKSQVSFEDTLLEQGIDVLDLQALEEYSIARQKRSLTQSKLSPEELLIKIGLASLKNGKFSIRVGAFVLFGRDGDQTLLQRDLTFVVYSDSESMYTYREDLSLPVTRMLTRIMELLRPFNRFAEEVHGLKRAESLYYPEQAIREALLNAIAHRDYRIHGLSNEIRVYPNRIEFISAGGLPGLMTLQNLEERHYSRNPKIVHALMTLGYVEELGQGIGLIKKLLKENGNPTPAFEAFQDLFKVTFFKKQQLSNIKAARERITSILKSELALTRSQIEAKTGIKSTTLKKILASMVEDKLITRSGKGRATTYSKS